MRLAEGQRGVEHAGLVDPPVGQRDDVGAAEEGAGSCGSGTNRSTKRTVPRARAAASRSGADVHPRAADDPQLRPVELPEGVEQHVDALVRAHQPEAEDHGALDRRPARPGSGSSWGCRVR